MKKIYFILIMLLTSPILQIHAWEKLSNNMDLSCEQNTGSKNIQCKYRSLDGVTPSSIEATLGSQTLVIKDQKVYPWMDATTSVLFMVDTSDPARQNVIDKNLKHIKILLNHMNPLHKAGLVSFDKNMRIHAEIGSSKEEILASMSEIKAVGKTTELYRNLIQGIDLLAKTPSERKNILIFSDGLAEDKAYFHNDVVANARKHNIIITSLGYPRSTTQSVALQRLRRISEETGGVFIEADSNFELKQAFLNNPFSSIDNGGVFNIDLSNVDYQDESIANKLLIQFTVSNETIRFKLPVDVPKTPVAKTGEAIAGQAPVKAMAETLTVPVQVKEPNVKFISPKENTKPYEKWLVYALPVALIVLLVLTITTFLITIWRPREKKYPEIQVGDLKPYAYLVLQEPSQKRFPITRTTWRIGRSKDNELSYNDNSISRRHCEIHRDQGDVFTLIDLNSLNGVFVNNEKIKLHQLKEGDIMEIGDVNFRFTLLSAEYSLEEATNIQKTKIPSSMHH